MVRVPKDDERERAAQEALLRGLRRAEKVIDDIRARATDPNSREALSEAMAAHIEARGEPTFRIDCYRCGHAVVDLPLLYRSARGLWTWMPPAYYVAQFNEEESRRRCTACGADFPAVHPNEQQN